VIQVQIQALLAGAAAAGRGTERSNMRSHMEVAKPPVFYGEAGKVGGFITAIVATTCWNGTRSLLTSAKLSNGYLVVGITRELDKEPLLYCSSIYINYMWSMLQQYLSALMSMHCPHVLLLIYMCFP